MQHHRHNPGFAFFKEPVRFNKHTGKDLLQYCLGAVLYMPGTRSILDKILVGQPPAPALVMCMEDAIKADDVEAAERNVLSHLDVISRSIVEGKLSDNELPLIFLRVRSVSQFRRFAARLNTENALALAGFVFPKFDSNNGHDYLETLVAINANLGVSLYGMPILEGHAIAFNETRPDELTKLAILMKEYRESILNIRVGATDFSSIFGVRRGINYSIYDIATVRDCLADILNVFSRSGSDYVISAPVWEYFLADKTESLDHLLHEDIQRSLMQRSSIINDAIDGLLREVILDKANGFVGKTIIHPSHARYVNALQAVTREEYEDASQILDTEGGVVKSAKANKMNEINPHRNWALKIRMRSQAYGVIEDEKSYLKLILGSAVGV
jgi:citrate lyase beta subunit